MTAVDPLPHGVLLGGLTNSPLLGCQVLFGGEEEAAGISIKGLWLPERENRATFGGQAKRRPLKHPEVKMLCRLHLAAPRSPLLRRALWPPARSLFEDLEREMESLWELLGGSRWPLGAHEEASRRPEEAPFAVTQDMAGFDPRELVVKLVGQKLVLTGRKATQTPGGPFRYELFRREWDVPGSVDRQQLRCSISSEGQLRIEAPAAGPAQARTVPIEVGQAVNGEEATLSTEGPRAKG